MVWKQDLAKLKQAFREAGGPPPPPVKPKPKPLEVKDLNDEDAMFLAAMGGPAPRPKPAPEVLPARPAPELAQAADISFEAGLAELKGLRPMGKPVAMPAPPEPPPPAEPALPRPLPALAEAETPVAAPETPEALTRGPLRIQLAAGMAIEVDASLDLRNHSVPDALGRLRDRIEDGAHMGWRTLHVVLGEDAALREAMMGFLSEGPAPRIGRYAQAPIPMGGAQAWVLYY